MEIRSFSFTVRKIYALEQNSVYDTVIGALRLFNLMATFAVLMVETLSNTAIEWKFLKNLDEFLEFS